MITDLIYSTCIVFLFASGAYLLTSKENEEYKFRRYEALRLKVKRGVSAGRKQKQANLLEDTGYFVEKERYIVVWMGMMCLMSAAGIALSSKLGIVMAGVVLLAGIPVENAMGHSTPFGIALKQLKGSYIHKKEKEMYDAMTMLRNMSIINKERPLSADAMIEELVGGSNHMAPHYLKMIHLVRLNKSQEALEGFIRDVKSPMAPSFARLLLKLDEINPSKMQETLSMYQKAIREEWVTKRRQKDELISDIIYVPAIANVLLIFMNFMVVAYFIPQKEFFGMFLR